MKHKKLSLLFVMFILVIAGFFLVQSLIGSMTHEGRIPYYGLLNNVTSSNLSNITTLISATTSPYDSLVLYYNFDADPINKTAFDFTSSANKANFTSGAFINYTGNIYGNSAGFDGVNDLIEGNTAPVFGNNLTISLWVKPNNISSARQSLVGLHGGNSVQSVVGFGALEFGNGAGVISVIKNGVVTVAGTGNVLTTGWHHIVYRRSNDTGTIDQSIYLDGVSQTLSTNDTSQGFTDDTTRSYVLGAKAANSATQPFNGSLDEIMIFNASLNFTQIDQIYKNQSTRFLKSGTIETAQTNISRAMDMVNVSINNFTRNFATNISVKIGFWNTTLGYNNTDWNSSVNGLVAYYHLDNSTGENETRVRDWVTGKFNGTIIQGGAIVNSSGYYGNGISFNTSNCIRVQPSSENFTGTFVEVNQITYSAWFNFAACTGTQRIIDFSNNGGSLHIIYVSGSNIAWLLSNNTGSVNLASGGVGTCTAKTWTHVLMTYNGSNTEGYVNGQRVFNNTGSTGMLSGGTTSNRALGIGAQVPFGCTQVPNGTIDEVMVFNRSLTAQEANELYIKGRALWNYTSEQNITGDSSNTRGYSNFSIPIGITNAYPYVKLTSDSNGFYTSTISRNLTLNFSSADGIAPNISLIFPGIAFNTSGQNISFNFTVQENYPFGLNCSLNLDSSVRNWNLTTVNNTLTSLNVSSISQGSHNWNVTCVDENGNTNTSSTNSFVIDFTPPNVTNVLFFPNVSDDVDPYKNVTFNATVSDDLTNVSAVILQIRNATDWFNTSMYRFSGNVFQANLTLIPTEQIYSYNIYANDTLSNFNITSNLTFNSSWDCNWNVTPTTLDAVLGYFTDKYVGNVTIINRGDAAFTNNNCTLNFTNSYSSFSDTYSTLAFNDIDAWISSSRGLQFISSVTYINASTNYTLLINASFPKVTSPLQEAPTLRVLSNIANNTNSSNNVTVTLSLVITPPGPYLFQSITTIPSTIYLTNQSLTLGAYIRNLAGNDTINNTAFNVSFNWTLPSTLSRLTIDGNQSNLYNKLENNSLIFNNITLNFTSSNLPAISPSSVSFRIYSFGYTNATGNLSLISHANNATLLITESNVTLSCYNVSDSICVSACGSTLDPDCTTPSTSSGGSSSGGGGGGGSAGGGSSASTSEELQLVRGKQNEIKVTFKNTNGATALTDLSFTLSGKLSKYMAVSPATWDYLGPGESMTLTLKVLSPTYIELGKQNIDVLISGKLGDLQYNEIKSLLLQVQDISPGEAKELIAQDKGLIAKLHSLNLTTTNLDKLLNESETGLANFNYAKIIENHATIEKNVNAAVDASKIIKDIQALIDDSKARGISTTGSERLIKLAELSLQRGDYEDAISRAKEAQVTYALEVKGEFSTVGYYLKNNTREIALGVLFLAIFSFGGYKLTQLQLLNNRIRRLKEEEKILTELIKVLQIETFKEKKMDISEYQQGMLQYEKRIADVIQNLIEAENKKANVLHFRSEVKKLQIERDNMVSLVKALQTDYLKNGTIENKVYELKMGSYNKRIAEIDQRMATREAEKALKGFGNGIFRKNE